MADTFCTVYTLRRITIRVAQVNIVATNLGALILWPNVDWYVSAKLASPDNTLRMIKFKRNEQLTLHARNVLDLERGLHCYHLSLSWHHYPANQSPPGRQLHMQ